LPTCSRLCAFERWVLSLVRRARRTGAAFCLLTAIASTVAGCGDFPRESPARSLQSSLRELAYEAPSDGHAYWLGPEFRDAKVTFADGSWGPYATLHYSNIDGSGAGDLDVGVVTYRWHAPDTSGTVFRVFRVRVRTATGQDAVLVFLAPKRPDAALVREARAALAPIPSDVTYDGYLK
jgi:hypothetical protein